MSLVPHIDNVRAGRWPAGEIHLLPDGTIAFEFREPLTFGPSPGLAREMLTRSLATRGLTPETWYLAGVQRKVFVNRKQGQRTDWQCAWLLEVRRALLLNVVANLLTRDALHYGENEVDPIPPEELLDHLVPATTPPKAQSPAAPALSKTKSPAAPPTPPTPPATASVPVPPQAPPPVPSKIAADELGLHAVEQEVIQAQLDNAEPLAGDRGALEITRERTANGVPGDAHCFVIRFPFNQELIESMQKMPGAWFLRERKSWVVPMREREALKAWLQAHAQVIADLADIARAKAQRRAEREALAKAIMEHPDPAGERKRLSALREAEALRRETDLLNLTCFMEHFGNLGKVADVSALAKGIGLRYGRTSGGNPDEYFWVDTTAHRLWRSTGLGPGCDARWLPLANEPNVVRFLEQYQFGLLERVPGPTEEELRDWLSSSAA